MPQSGHRILQKKPHRRTFEQSLSRPIALIPKFGAKKSKFTKRPENWPRRFLSKKNVDKMCRDPTLARTKKKINGRNFDSLHLHFRFRSPGS